MKSLRDEIRLASEARTDFISKVDFIQKLFIGYMHLLTDKMPACVGGSISFHFLPPAKNFTMIKGSFSTFKGFLLSSL